MAHRIRTHARRNLVAYLALTVALTLTAGIAYSAIPDSNNVIHGCYINSSGALRVIDTDASGVCRVGETALDWNQQGPPGVPGAQGPQGAKGVQGPPGVGTVYAKSAGGPKALPDPGQPKTVVSVTVPRGSYVITGKAIGGLTVPPFSCAPGTEVQSCNLKHINQRLGSTIFGCAVVAGGSSDLGRANLVAGVNQLSAYQTVSANVIHSFTGPSNKIRLSCLQYAGGKWPAKLTNARLIAMKVDRVDPQNLFRAVAPKIRKSKSPLRLQQKP